MSSGPNPPPYTERPSSSSSSSSSGSMDTERRGILEQMERDNEARAAERRPSTPDRARAALAAHLQTNENIQRREAPAAPAPANGLPPMYLLVPLFAEFLRSHPLNPLNNAPALQLRPNQHVDLDHGSPSPPPAYHTVVRPNDPIDWGHNPYHPESDGDEESNPDPSDAEAESDDSSDEESPDVNVNAAAIVLGSGNMVTVTPLTAHEVANAAMSIVREINPFATHQTTPTLQGPGGASSQLEVASQATDQALPERSLNITVNCGTTIIGDRNLVGPQLLNVLQSFRARMYNQQRQAQQHRMMMQIRVQQLNAASTSVPRWEQGRNQQQQAGSDATLPATPTPTPAQPQPRNRTTSIIGVKRKAEGYGDEDRRPPRP
ncbi:hypothetical protein K504DRAFT_64366 [Pleomassaria siparia CBS 279.74]|uniref:Uncharacterized protein n=1 Tax=Pleomassaria siparia CBS 279.74 TaxID=1314801 RepID=A0A6G1K1R0_9PLEO|nr:hypothetical protein K504DRAFT_64366 [Pleomassaria siparia CBS 279.74]